MVSEAYNALAAELRERKTICLFAILKMDEITDRWSLLVGAKNINSREDEVELFKVVRAVALRHLASEIQNVARIGVFPLDEHIIEDLLKYPEGSELKDVRANGSFVTEGYVLISAKT